VSDRGIVACNFKTALLDGTDNVAALRAILVYLIDRGRAEGKRAAAMAAQEEDAAAMDRLRKLAEPREEAPSGMRIEKRDDGEWLAGIPNDDINDCPEERDGWECHYHVGGEHVATHYSDTAADGAERIMARWPIAPAQDEPQVPREERAMVSIDRLVFAGAEATDVERANLVAWLTEQVREVLQGSSRDHGDVHMLYSADGRLRLTMPKDADSRAVLATVAELLGLDFSALPEDEARLFGHAFSGLKNAEPDRVDAEASDMAGRLPRLALWCRGYACGIREGERRAQAQAKDPTAAPDREQLGRAVHQVWIVSQPCEWEELEERDREDSRRIGERLFAMGVEEGERRAAEKALATARGIVDAWDANRSEEMRDAGCVEPHTEAWYVRRQAAIVWAACAREIRAAFNLPADGWCVTLPRGAASPADDKPPTGGEPAPEDSAPIWFAVGNIAAHEGHVTSVSGEDWTYQRDVTGAHGTVLYEGPSESEARSVLSEWLKCDAVEKGEYCYAHNRRDAWDRR